MKSASGVAVNVNTKDMGLDALQFTLNGEDFLEATPLNSAREQSPLPDSF